MEQPLRAAESSGPWLVFGLGNPGPEYESTRHNAGYLAIDELSRYCRIPLNGTSRHAIYGRGRWKAAEAILVKPMRYMNRSGWAVEELIQKFGYPPDRRVVNMILKENFASNEIELEFEGPDRGGYNAFEQEATLLRIRTATKNNLCLAAT